MTTFPKGLSEQEIIVRIVQNQEKELFSHLYNAYKTKVYNKCFSLVKDRDTAMELVQEIFLKALEKLVHFRQASSFSTWIYAITYNTAIEYLRNRKKMNYTQWVEDNEPVDTYTDVSEDDIMLIRAERLNVLLAKIHPEERVILIMKYKDNMSLKAIQKVLNISESAAKMRLKRARARVMTRYNTTYRAIDED